MIKTNDFMEIMKGRRSIRNYDPTVKISKEEMTEILEEATTAPSSVNAQPWRFLVIDSPEGKEKLAPLASFNQTQVTTSSAVIAVFADMNNADYLEDIYSKAVELGYMPQEVKDRQIAALTAHFEKLPAQVNRETILIDGGLVSMQLMLTARAHGYDTNPIGGYDKENIAEAFGLDKERYVPVMLLSIGKAADEGYASYRLPVDTIAEWK
ncbi:nitroreductase family protein [Bacillus mojavensis]|uniref:Oxygen-insensitive NAD(P)H nitroreductase / Dihydropteridine reductase n=2 Tax=Bacillus mojavensis TaxID=72360 RepID=A0ABX6LTA5_BACMO|nr:nitroreductase family protein [Bacillus mojavensis]MDR4229151.1 nitroreductase family protein [Bacillus mojavensis]MEC1667028.1 nitroreductase family protein [Bacillus mojavensis]MEC1689733.1 nitroreductase family protein [Bacillus mojavensis]MEC1738279.1 nitroreductase family protein [Bacillus mojavensis]MEC3587419.1 nitroreductase family protein [Bacillus mojavensis]